MRPVLVLNGPNLGRPVLLEDPPEDLLASAFAEVASS